MEITIRQKANLFPRRDEIPLIALILLISHRNGIGVSEIIKSFELNENCGHVSDVFRYLDILIQNNVIYLQISEDHETERYLFYSNIFIVEASSIKLKFCV